MQAYEREPLPPSRRSNHRDSSHRKNWSGRRDSNSRPSAPKADALPGCATPRLLSFYRTRLHWPPSAPDFCLGLPPSHPSPQAWRECKPPRNNLLHPQQLPASSNTLSTTRDPSSIFSTPSPSCKINSKPQSTRWPPPRSIRPYRPAAQDSASSRRQHRFESCWGRHTPPPHIVLSTTCTERTIVAAKGTASFNVLVISPTLAYLLNYVSMPAGISDSVRKPTSTV
jgi:hypothetical protein